MPLFLYWARCIEIFGDNVQRPADNLTSLCIQISAGNNTKLLDKLEKDITNMKIYLQVASTLTTIISAPLLGRWSDRSGGRKLPLIICLSGLVFYCAIHTASIFFYTTINVYYFQFSAELISGCLGGLVTIFTLSSAIVVDDSRAQMNMESSTVPVRIGISCAAQSIGMLLGMLLTNLLLVPVESGAEAHVRGYFYAVFSAFLFALMALFYTVFKVKESYDYEEPLRLRSQSNAARATTHECSTPFKSLRKFVFEIFEVVSEKREGYMRLCLNLCIFFMFVEFLAFDNTLLTLVVKRPPFSWEDSTFTHFAILRSFVSSIGMALMPFILDKTNFTGKESIMIMVGIAACIATSLMLAFATATFMVFASTMFAWIIGGISPGYRTLMPKMVPQNQTARLFAFIGIIIMLTPLLSSLIFNNIYNATMDFWPGFVFIIYAALNFVVLCGQLLVHGLMLPIWRRGPIREEDAEVYENPNFEEQPSANPIHEVEFENQQSNSSAGNSDSTEA
uniref:Proton-coupled folate transporter n=1 Tax=Acrobeloides nanus TaxID=290746 RepID=A0A914CC36_9BILA